MKIPNILTLCRLLGAPLFLWAFLTDAQAGPVIALALVITFELTDLADGFLARRLEQVSQLGKILDPLADSVSRFTVFLAFLVGPMPGADGVLSAGEGVGPVAQGYASVWAIAFIFYRDAIVSTVRIFAASQGVIVSARWSGKLKAIVQATAIITIVAARAFPEVIGQTPEWVRDSLANPMMWVVAAVTTLSLFDYVFGNREILKRLDR